MPSDRSLIPGYDEGRNSGPAQPEGISVTVLVPMRNAERNVVRCLNAIMANDYPSRLVEIIVVDAMSTDASPDIVRNYVARHSSIRMLVNPGRALGNGRSTKMI